MPSALAFLIVASLFGLVMGVAWPNRIVELSDFPSATRMLRSTDEISVVLIYDSADVNSLRVVPDFIQSSAPLDGFASFYAADMRNPRISVLLDSWSIQYVPTIRGLSWTRGLRPTWDKTALSAVGGVRNPVDWPAEQPITANSLKTFALNLQGQGSITRVDSDGKVGALVDEMRKTGPPRALLISSKATSSQLYKAVAIAYNGRCDFLEVNNAKAPSAAKAFGVKDVPSLMVFDSKGHQHFFSGDLSFASISTFVNTFVENRTTFQTKRLIDENRILQRETQRRSDLLLAVETEADWRLDVINRQSITGVFFIDSSTEAVKERSDAVKAFFNIAGSRPAVTRFVWLDRTKSPSLFQSLTRVEGQEPAELIFISAKRKVYQRFLGEPTGRAIADFVKGPMSRGVGSVAYESLPDFGN